MIKWKGIENWKRERGNAWRAEKEQRKGRREKMAAENDS